MAALDRMVTQLIRQRIKRLFAPPRRRRYAPQADLEHIVAHHREWCFECEDSDQRAMLAHELQGDWDRGRESA